MPHRYERAGSSRWRLPRLGSALRESLAAGYRGADLRADLMAGLVVGVVALPLAMALAIAAGAAPQHGLYTAIVAGAVIALLGGSRSNVSGPTAAFVVVLAPIAAQHGIAGLLVATLMAGVLLMLMGAARMGRLIHYIPYPVTTGFTAGIAVVIALLQVKDFLGLQLDQAPHHLLERCASMAAALPTARLPDVLLGLATLALLLLWPKLTRKIPAPLVALSCGGVAAYLLAQGTGEHSVATIGSRFSYVFQGVEHAGIPQLPPHFVWPWELPGPTGQPLELSLGLVRELLGPALAIALLGAIESLLCAVVADGMAGTRHDPDVELMAQGAGNLLAPFFGGIAATGAIARTATSVRAGSRSPLAAVVHALVILAAVLVLAPLLSWLPMASLAALLLVVAWNMSEARHFAHILRVAPRSDTVVLLTCFTLTVAFDMVLSVTVGVVLAALLFMRRMAESASVTRVGATAADAAPADSGPSHAGLPADVLLYEIAGPLFFGAAEKAVSAFQRSQGSARAVILDLHSVPVMDVTGLVALESALDRLKALNLPVVLVGLRAQPRQLLERAGRVETQAVSVPAALEALRSQPR